MTIKVLFKDGTEEEFSKGTGWSIEDNYLTIEDDDEETIAACNFDEVKYIKE